MAAVVVGRCAANDKMLSMFYFLILFSIWQFPCWICVQIINFFYYQSNDTNKILVSFNFFKVTFKSNMLFEQSIIAFLVATFSDVV